MYLKVNGKMIEVPEEVICLEESCDYFVWMDQVFHKEDLVDEKDL